MEAQRLKAARSDAASELVEAEAAWGREREITLSLRRELASLPSLEDTEELRMSLAEARELQTQAETESAALMSCLLVAVQRSSLSVEFLRSEVCPVAAKNQEGVGAREWARRASQMEALMRTNAVLTHQVIALLRGRAIDPTLLASAPFPTASPEMEAWSSPAAQRWLEAHPLEVAEVDAGLTLPRAASTQAAQSALIADLQRSLTYTKAQLAAVSRPGDEGDPPRRLAELEDQLEEARRLAELYYDKLQSGSAYLRSLQAESAERETQQQGEIDGLREQLRAAWAKVQEEGEGEEAITLRLRKSEEECVQLEQALAAAEARVLQLSDHRYVSIITSEITSELEARGQASRTLLEQEIAELRHLLQNASKEDDKLKSRSEAEWEKKMESLHARNSELASQVEELGHQLSEKQTHQSRREAELLDMIKRMEVTSTALAEQLSLSYGRLQAAAERATGQDQELAVAEAAAARIPGLQDELNTLFIQISVHQTVAEQAEEAAARAKKESEALRVALDSAEEREKRLEEQGKGELLTLQSSLMAMERRALKAEQQLLELSYTAVPPPTNQSCQNEEVQWLKAQLEVTKKDLKDALGELQNTRRAEPGDAQLLQELIRCKMELATLSAELDGQRLVMKKLRAQAMQDHGKAEIAEVQLRTGIGRTPKRK